MLRVTSVTHRYEGRTVLRDISFSVGEGEILAIMGSSGGGKTTLLKVISGLLTPSEGDILVGERSIVHHPEGVAGLVGLVFQNAALFDFMDVSENILFGVRRARRVSRSEGDEIVAELLSQVALGAEVARQMPSELSGGMRKRVGLARALAMEPRILLYDEPTSGLDPVTAYAIDQLIVQTRDRHGLTSVVVSHDVNSVFRVADRIAFLNLGDLAFWGTPEEFRRSHDPAIDDLVEKSRAEYFFSQA